MQSPDQFIISFSEIFQSYFNLYTVDKYNIVIVMSASILNLRHLLCMTQFVPRWETNEGLRVVTHCFLDISNGKSYIVDLSQNKGDQNQHI